MSSHDFGKPALRNSGATSHRTLLILNHEVFEDLIKNPFIKPGSPEPQPRPAIGCWMCDMRKNTTTTLIPDAVLVPLCDLPNRMDELDKNQRYIVYCYAGGCSAVATLILNQNQFDVVSLENGSATGRSKPPRLKKPWRTRANRQSTPIGRFDPARTIAGRSPGYQ